MKRIFIQFLMFLLLSVAINTHAADPRFVDLNNGTMYDTVSKLLWLKNANCFGGQKWDSAMSRSNELANGQCGLSDASKVGDWHLPTIDELRIFNDAGYYSDALNTAGFQSVQSYGYWSSTSYDADTIYAWIVYMNVGYVNYNYKTNDFYYVWPVRSGQYWPFGSLVLFASPTDYGSVPGGTTSPSKQVYLRNNGGSAVTITSTTLTGSTPDQFSVAPGDINPCSSLTPTLEAGASCTMAFFANPTSSGAKAANLTLTTATGSLEIPLSVIVYSTIHGMVTDMSSGLPVSGATVTINTGATATTDTNGVYDFGSSITAGSYNVTVFKDGYQSVTVANATVTATSSAVTNVWLPTPGFLNIPAQTLPLANLTQPYSYHPRVSGGTWPYTFSLPEGSSLPPGITLNSATGVLSGIPTAAGVYNFSIGVTDSTPNSFTAERMVTLIVVAPLSITTSSLPNATVNNPYYQQVTTTGGLAPFSFSVSGGVLPDGLYLDSSLGQVYGTPYAPGLVNFEITVSDSSWPKAQRASKSFNIRSKTPQYITLASFVNKTYGNTDYASGASIDTGLPLTYQSSNSAVATVSVDGMVHIVGAGTATITASQAGDAIYAPASAQQTLTAYKAPLTVTVDNKQRSYNSANPTFTVTYSGFVKGEDNTVLAGTPALSSAAILSSPVGDYPITATLGTLSSTNYSFNYVSGTLTISKLQASISIDAATLVQGYTGAPRIVTATTDPPGLTYNVTYNGSSTAPSAFGTYLIVATITDPGYQGSANAVLTISDSVPPTISIFLIPGTSANRTVPITLFNASDNTGITGWCLTETPDVATCQWKQAKPTSVTFSQGGSKTIYVFVTDAAGNMAASSGSVTITVPSFTLSVSINGTGGGTVQSSPLTDIACIKGSSAGCSGLFESATDVILTAVPESTSSTFTGWNIPGCSTAICQISMNADKTATATFTLAPRIKLALAATSGYDTLPLAYGSAASTIFALEGLFAGEWVLAGGKDIILKGGYLADYGPVRNGFTTVRGKLTITNGSLRVDGVKVSQ